MKKGITNKTTIEAMAALVCTALHSAGIEAFLSGGAVVSIYTNNEYESWDLDFVSLADRNKIKKVMLELGFKQDKGRHYVHPNSKIFVEFPGSAIQIGQSLIEDFAEIKNSYGTLRLLTPTDCVLDRLAGYFYWNDPQSLDQAVNVAKRHPVNLGRIRKWGKSEGQEKKLEVFLDRLTRKD